VRDVILQAALEMSAKPGGFKSLTRDGVAAHAHVATGLVTYYFKSMKKLRDAVVTTAIAGENLAVLSEAIGYRHAKALNAPHALRVRALKSFIAQQGA